MGFIQLNFKKLRLMTGFEVQGQVCAAQYVCVNDDVFSLQLILVDVFAH